MSKKRLTAWLIAVLMLVVGVFAACQPSDNGETPSNELKDGVITYDDAVCESIVGKDNSGTVATAVASNGATVSYALDEEAQGKLTNAFDGALTVAADGTIVGKYDKIKKIKVNITASAEKCPSVTAEITISVVNAHLDFDGRTLADARVGVAYAASVAYVKDEVDVTYRAVDKLPDGLTMASDGTITGTPTKVGPGEAFVVRASSKGYSDTEAEFVIDVVLNHVSTTPSKIVNFGANKTTELEPAYVGIQYVNQSGVAGNATALNGNNVTYTLADGYSLPEGMTLYPNGAVIGKSTERSDCNFSVVAHADGCEDVTANFVLSVKPQRIKFESLSGELTIGEQANYSIATADAGEGVDIKYTMTVEDAATLKAIYGLEVSPSGVVTGTPTKVVKLMNFRVTAEADGFSPCTVTMYFRINEPLQAPSNGRFEAEYVDLTGKSGTGYSASPTGESLIDTTLPQTSNGAFINYMHNDTITLEFVVYAEATVTNAPLYFALGSEMGAVQFTPSSLGIYTYVGKTTDGAKTTVSYTSVRVEGGNRAYSTFNEYRFGSVSLVEGWNVIQIAVHTNTLREGMIGGPGVDYMRIDTSVAVKWVPCTYNLAN